MPDALPLAHRAVPFKGRQDVVERGGEFRHIAVIERADVELPGESAQQIGPLVPARITHAEHINSHLDAPLNHLHRRPAAGGRRAGLLPGPLAAGGGAALRNPPPRTARDRPAAPAALDRSGPAPLPFVGLRQLITDPFPIAEAISSRRNGARLARGVRVSDLERHT